MLPDKRLHKIHQVTMLHGCKYEKCSYVSICLLCEAWLCSAAQLQGRAHLLSVHFGFLT